MIHEKAKKITEITQRRERAAELHLSGHKQREIAKQLKCDISTVSRDIAVIRKQWKESAISDYGEKVAIECQRLDAIEREAWEGWRRSQEPEITTEEHIGKDGKTIRTVTKTKGLAGALAFLTTAINCVKSRCNLLGLGSGNLDSGVSPNTPISIIFESAPNVPLPHEAEEHQAAIEYQSDQSEKIG